MIKQLKGEPRRRLVIPSAADLKVAQTAFASIRKDWAAASPRNHELLAKVQGELAQLRGKD